MTSLRREAHLVACNVIPGIARRTKALVVMCLLARDIVNLFKENFKSTCKWEEQNEQQWTAE